MIITEIQILLCTKVYIEGCPPDHGVLRDAGGSLQLSILHWRSFPSLHFPPLHWPPQSTRAGALEFESGALYIFLYCCSHITATKCIWNNCSWFQFPKLVQLAKLKAAQKHNTTQYNSTPLTHPVQLNVQTTLTHRNKFYTTQSNLTQLNRTKHNRSYLAYPHAQTFLVFPCFTSNWHKINQGFSQKPVQDRSWVSRALSSLPNWNNGRNHLIFSLLPPSTPLPIGQALLATSAISQVNCIKYQLFWETSVLVIPIFVRFDLVLTWL